MKNKTLIICVLLVGATLGFARGGWGGHWRGGWGGGYWHGGWGGYWFGLEFAPYYVPVYPEVVAYPPVVVSPPAVTYQPIAPAQQLRVYVSYAGNDIVGTNLQFAVQEQLQSAGVVLARSPGDATIEVNIASTDQDASQPGSSSAVSVSYLRLPGRQLVTSQMLIVQATQVAGVASSIVEYTGKLKP